MRVLHVDTAREWRGGQTQLLHLVRGSGDAVALPADAALRPALEAAGVEVIPVAFHGVVRGIGGLSAAIRRWRPDLVAAHTAHAHGQAVVAGRAPVVVHRRVDFAPGRGPLSRWKRTRAAGWIAVSDAVAQVLAAAGVDPERIAVVRDGVDPGPIDAVGPEARVEVRRALGVPDDAFVVGAVGALVPHKGHKHLIEALAWLDNQRQDVWGVIAGEGPERDALQGLADQWKIAPRVRLLGARDDVPRLLRAFDVFAHPSVEEGLGQAVIEAMLAGVPVVASQAGGVPEVVDDLITGLIVRAGDGEALARALNAAIRGRERALQRAEAARVRASTFGVDAMVEGTRAAYARFVS